MGYDLLAGLLFAGLLPMVILGFVVSWALTRRDREEVERTWRRYAAQRGLTFTEPEGVWPNRTSPVLTWTGGDVAFRLEALGRETHTRTRLTVRPRGKLLGRVSVAARTHAVAAARPIDLGDATFVAAYRVLEQPEGLARRVLGDEVRRGLLAFRQGDSVTLGYRRGQALLEWPGGERSDARLDEARRLGTAVAEALERAFLSARSAPRDAA